MCGRRNLARNFVSLHCVILKSLCRLQVWKISSLQSNRTKPRGCDAHVVLPHWCTKKWQNQSDLAYIIMCTQWRTQKIFIGGWFRVIWWPFVFGVLFVTSQFDVIFMFPNQRFGKVCWHNNAYFSTSTPFTSSVITRSKFGYRRKINSTLRHSSS